MKIIRLITVLILLSVVVSVQSCTPTQAATDTNKVATAADIASLYDINDGSELQLKNLTYYLDRPITISNKTDFVLDGNGATFIMKNKAEDVVYVNNSTNITLKNFKATHIEPEGPIGCTGSVIQIYRCETVTVENCELNGSGIIGVVGYETKNLKVADNYIYNNSKYGVLYDSDCTIEITGNRFEDNGDDGNYHVAKALDGGLSQVDKVEGDKNETGLKMSKNKYE